ncbi:MAG TPA: phosphatidylglycerophosphatase A [Blastocatellia bacterium]|nr:phosphatidylglycerophosphatase A [Blastocatellia bacterium]
MPIAPGTFGALEGVGIFVLFRLWLVWTTGSLSIGISIWVLINVLVFFGGVAASGRLCSILKQKDPSRAVIDEVSGQMISLTPLLFASGWIAILAGFVLFRLFDIWKPYPIRKLERLPNGWGVMMDDVLAGVYAAVLVWVGLALFAGR